MNVFECPFHYHARTHPTLLALTTPQKSWNYQDCNKLIHVVCNALNLAGVKPGDRVAIYPTPCFPTPLIFFSLFRLQATACILNTCYPLKQLSKLLDSFTATYFLFPDTIQAQLPPIKQIKISFSSLFRHQGKNLAHSYLLHKDSHGTYLLTSGTTSAPKIACHSLGNHYYSALGSNAYLPIQPHDRWLLALPLYHVAGIALLFRAFLAGATVALSNNKPYRAKTLLQTKTTHVSFVPTQLHHLLETASHEELLQLHYQLKVLLLGGTTIIPSLYYTGRNQGLPIVSSYGMTEMSSQICSQCISDFPFSLGHPLPYRDIYTDKKQEIYVRGKTLFLGYLDHDIHLPLNSNEYFATGDLGTYCPKKGLFLHGRKDRLFISGGENIYPEEIENYLKQIVGITDAYIQPKKDSIFGMRPIAFIESKKSFRKRELQEYLETFLPKFKIPIAFYPLQDLKNKNFKTHLE